VQTCPKNGRRTIISKKKKVKVDTYWKKENRETENKTERRRVQSHGRLWSTRWRLGGQTSLETGCRKTLPYVIERLHTYIILTNIHSTPSNPTPPHKKSYTPDWNSRNLMSDKYCAGSQVCYNSTLNIHLHKSSSELKWYTSNF
jgi:hypothetical protein